MPIVKNKIPKGLNLILNRKMMQGKDGVNNIEHFIEALKSELEAREMVGGDDHVKKRDEKRKGLTKNIMGQLKRSL